MGLDLNAVAAQTAIAKVDYMGQSASVIYNPSVLTAANIKQAQSGEEGFIEIFTTLVKDWDVKSGAKKVPLTEKGLMGVPIPLLKAIFTAVNKSGAGDPEEGKASSAG